MYYTGLEKKIEQSRKKLCALQEEYDSIKGGALHIRVRGGRYYFWEYLNRRQIGITSNKERVYQLARKKYLEAAIASLVKKLGVLETAHKALMREAERDTRDDVIEYCKMLDIDRVIHSAKEQAWINRKKSANPYRPEDLRYATTQGVMTRSKSERLIGNVLEARSVVYVSEPQVQIGSKVYYPDFMILRKDGTMVIWEHCGLMDDKDYAYKTLMKIEKYRSIGYVPTDNLIYTFEEDLENMTRLNEIIDKFIDC